MCFAAEALGQDILVAPRQAIKGGKITEAACCSLMGVLLAKRVRNQGMQNLEKKQELSQIQSGHSLTPPSPQHIWGPWCWHFSAHPGDRCQSQDSRTQGPPSPQRSSEVEGLNFWLGLLSTGYHPVEQEGNNHT